MIKIHQLASKSAVAIWAVPLSGFGHTADEQPMPYIQINSQEVTPRFGGEERFTICGMTSLPLPYGKLGQRWPISHALHNFSRRKANIYWRNIFKTKNRKDKMFFLLSNSTSNPQNLASREGLQSSISPEASLLREIRLSFWIK